MHFYPVTGLHLNLERAAAMCRATESLPQVLVDIDALDVMEIPTTPTWLKYNKTDLPYEVGFLNRVHEIDPWFVADVCAQLTQLMGCTFTEDHFVLIRTLSDSAVHRDQSAENGRINIGLLNSKIALTRFFDPTGTELVGSYQLQDGEAMILDTNKKHQVKVNEGQSHKEFRYLASMCVFHSLDRVYHNYLWRKPGDPILPNLPPTMKDWDGTKLTLRR